MDTEYLSLNYSLMGEKIALMTAIAEELENLAASKVGTLHFSSGADTESSGPSASAMRTANPALRVSANTLALYMRATIHYLNCAVEAFKAAGADA